MAREQFWKYDFAGRKSELLRHHNNVQQIQPNICRKSKDVQGWDNSRNKAYKGCMSLVSKVEMSFIVEQFLSIFLL